MTSIPPTPAAPTSSPAPSKPTMSKKAAIWSMVGICVVALGIGNVSAKSDTKTETKTEVKTVTSIVTKNVPGPTKTVTKTVTVPGPEIEKTPQSCLDALDTAQEIFSLAAQGFGAASDAIAAAASNDGFGIVDAGNTMQSLSGQITSKGESFTAAAAECRSK